MFLSSDNYCLIWQYHFDTTHFPYALAQYPFKGKGCYLITGKIVEDFGFPSLDVIRMEKLPNNGFLDFKCFRNLDSSSELKVNLSFIYAKLIDTV